MAASANMFYIAIDNKNETNVKVAVSSLNIKVRQLFSNRQILGVREAIVERKMSVDLSSKLSNSLFSSFMKMENEKRSESVYERYNSKK